MFEVPFLLPDMNKDVSKENQGTYEFPFMSFDSLSKASNTRNEINYLNALTTVISKGAKKEDRTGTGTISKFGIDMRFDLSEGFPLLTTKKIHWKSVVHELLFFIRGGKYSDDLEKVGVNIWKEWPGDKDKGTYIPYGAMWRDFNGIDQIAWVIQEIRNNPDSRRLVVSTWNPSERENFVLDPCHVLFQFYVEPLRAGETKRRLSCQLYQRSADMFLGVD